MKENRKKTIRISILILILLIGIGYAALKTTLKIDGTVNVDKTTWDVHFENVSITEGSVTANPAPTTNNTDTTEMTYTINFTKPGDFFEFTVDIVNDGTIDAMVNSVSNKTYNVTGTTETQLPPYLINAVTYDDGMEIAPNHLLEHGTSERIKVRVEFKKDISASDLPSDGDTTIVFKFLGDFKQADENACPKPTTFEKDSWETIQCNVKNNPTSYSVGSTKTIKMDLNNDSTEETYTLRVANNTTPAECNGTDFSETACGFVVEFQDIVENRAMGPYGDYSQTGYGNTGGWEASDMRAYLNGGIYTAGNIDYSETGFINKLPNELKKIISNTTVVSSHGSNDSSNFTTTDKIYLLSTKEIWGKEGTSNIIYYDSAEVETRQLDYYKSKGVTTCAFEAQINVVKKYLTGAPGFWWLRSADDSNDDYYRVEPSGEYARNYYNTQHGVSPAFRIG